MQIQRSIGTISMVFAALGGIIGSGWLLGPYYVAKLAGPAGVFSWVIGGVMMMIIAMTFAELATLFPLAGGVVKFPQFSHGLLVSFTMSWIGWLSCLVVPPLETMAFLQYAANYFPSLVHEHTHTFTYRGIACAAVLLFLMSALNAVGVSIVAKANAAIVWIKLLIPTVVVVTLGIVSFHLKNFYNYPSFAPNGLKPILQALPAAGVVFSFIGFTPAIALAGESKDPQRVLPKAIIGSLFICMLLYIALQIVFIGVLNPDHLSTGWQQLNFAGDKGPFAGIAASLGLVWLLIILYIAAFVSPLGTALTYTTATARMNYAMSQNGYMPQAMLKLNKKGVPMNAIFLNFAIGLLLLFPFPGWREMVNFLVSAIIISYAVGPLSLTALRKIIPHQHRPFRLPAAYLVSFFAFYFCNLIVYWTGWDAVWRILLATLAGYLVFPFFRAQQKAKQLPLQLNSLFWLIPYFIGLAVISYLGDFGGGKHIIPFGLDFAIIAIFSAVIFSLANIFHNSPEELQRLLNE